MKKTLLLSSFVAIGALAAVISSCNPKPAEQPTGVMTPEQMVAKGNYLVSTGGCNDCHSPKIMTHMGPVADTTKLLSGSPSGMPLPTIDTAALTPGHWYLGSPDLTAWVGPWGMSFSANLTPSNETGIGGWTEEMFIKILRSGKTEAGRPIMPPMPWEGIAKMTDEDLKCIFAYLRSLKPINNKVHDYVPPPGIMAMNVTKK